MFPEKQTNVKKWNKTFKLDCAACLLCNSSIVRPRTLHSCELFEKQSRLRNMIYLLMLSLSESSADEPSFILQHTQMKHMSHLSSFILVFTRNGPLIINFGHKTWRHFSHVIHYYTGLWLWVLNRWQKMENLKESMFSPLLWYWCIPPSSM